MIPELTKPSKPLCVAHVCMLPNSPKTSFPEAGLWRTVTAALATASSNSACDPTKPGRAQKQHVEGGPQHEEGRVIESTRGMCLAEIRRASHKGCIARDNNNNEKAIAFHTVS